MNKINPMYLIAFLCVIVAVLYAKKASIITATANLTSQSEQTQSIGSYRQEMEKEFDDKQRVTKKVKSLLSKHKYLSSPNKFTTTPTQMKIKIIDTDSKKINKAIGSILNESVYISSFSMEDDNFTKTIEIEIRL